MRCINLRIRIFIHIFTYLAHQVIPSPQCKRGAPLPGASPSRHREAIAAVVARLTHASYHDGGFAAPPTSGPPSLPWRPHRIRHFCILASRFTSASPHHPAVWRRFTEPSTPSYPGWPLCANVRVLCWVCNMSLFLYLLFSYLVSYPSPSGIFFVTFKLISQKGWSLQIYRFHSSNFEFLQPCVLWRVLCNMELCWTILTKMTKGLVETGDLTFTFSPNFV